LEKLSRIPPWVRRFGFFGLLLFGIFVILSLAVEAIFEQEVQQWWERGLKPFLFSPTSIEILVSVQGWIVLAGVVVLVVGVSGAAYLFACLQKKGKGGLDTSLSPPSNLGSTGLTPTDVVNAVVDARGGRITSDFLVDDIVIKAANCGVIRPQAAAEVLEEFGFELIFRSDGSYSYTRKAEGKDR